MDINTRFCHILIDGEWRKAHPSQIRINDLVRLYEDDGTPVVHGCTHEVYATSEAFMHNGVWTFYYKIP